MLDDLESFFGGGPNYLATAQAQLAVGQADLQAATNALGVNPRTNYVPLLLVAGVAVALFFAVKK